MTLAVIGLGSIGRRHVGNFRTLGVDVKAWDIAPQPGLVGSLDEALAGVDGVVICTPPDSHLAYARLAFARYLPVMIEKPLAHTSEDAAEIVRGAHEAGVPVLVAYPWRYWPPLRYVKALLDEQRIGTVLSARTEYGCHLERHMPNHARPDSYMRSLSRGGGCLLDTSHALDYVRWLLGDILQVAGVVERRALAIDADDSADLLLRMRSGAVVTPHLSLCLPTVTGRLEIVGAEGSIAWFRTIGVLLNGQPTAHFSPTAPDLNAMYLAEAEHFLDVIEGTAAPRCTAWDGYQTMRVIDAARKASEERRWVEA